MNQSIQCSGRASRSSAVPLSLILVFLSIAKSHTIEQRQPLLVVIKSELRHRPSIGSHIRFPIDAQALHGVPFDGLGQQRGTYAICR